MTIPSPMTLTFIQGHKCVSNRTTFLTCNISDNSLSYYIQAWHDSKLMDAIIILYARAHFGDLGDARSQWVSKGTKSPLRSLSN